jgi:hypothetical protein
VDGTQTPVDLDATRREIAECRERMAVLQKEAEVAVDAGWQSQYRNPAVFALKVETRLSGSQEYLGLVRRVREAEAVLAAAGETA